MDKHLNPLTRYEIDYKYTVTKIPLSLHTDVYLAEEMKPASVAAPGRPQKTPAAIQNK